MLSVASFMTLNQQWSDFSRGARGCAEVSGLMTAGPCTGTAEMDQVEVVRISVPDGRLTRARFEGSNLGGLAWRGRSVTR
jgi:hypothetical protein